MDTIDAHVYVGNGVRMQLGVDALLRLMDEAGVAVAVACPMDRYAAVANREGNDLLLDAVRAHPDRIRGMAVANPWFGEGAREELRRALGEGLKGVYVNSVLQGFRLCEHLVDPVLEAAAEAKVPVYLHTGTAGVAEPFHAAELARRHPTVNFIMGHAGASDYGLDAVSALQFADNLWLETSRNGPANAGLWQVRACVGKVVFGSSAPEYIPAVELETLREVFRPAEQEQVLRANIERVFGGRLTP